MRDGACLARAAAPGRDQAARLLPAIDALLKEAGVGRREVGLLAVTVGPGSFTGVRVGLAAARGLALALDVPLAGFATTSVLLAQAPADPARIAVAAIDSRLGDWFCAIAGEETPFVAAADALASRLAGKPVTLVGPEAEALAAALRQRGIDVVAHQELPDPVRLAGLALARGAAHWKALGMPRPLYLRGVNVTSPDGARRTVQ